LNFYKTPLSDSETLPTIIEAIPSLGLHTLLLLFSPT